ncbi:MAG TPA: transcriptional regulator CynR [Roseiflexaceae bacterium]|nr:transcriptional regulator CynR [Roseiflexaceae bacterium]
MELRQLRYFLTVAEEGHFTRAAERLYISQPALSQQIRQLEAELGAVLLDRAGRRVRLTDSGEVVAHYARRALQELDAAQVALGELAGLRRGSLAVGVVQTVNAYLMPRAVAAFATAHPGISLRVEERAAGAIESGLLAGELHLGVGFVPPADREIEAEALFSEALVLIVAEEHPLAAREYVEVRELDGQPMVLLAPAFCTRRLWDSCAQQAGARPRVLVEMNTIGGVLASVRRTAAATVLPALALAADPPPGLHGIPLVNPTPQRTVGLLYRRGGYRCTAARAFAALFRDVAGAATPPCADAAATRGLSALEPA